MSDERLTAVRDWAGKLTAEGQSSDALRDYVQPKAIAQVLRSVENPTGAMFAIVGLQGTGKTSAYLALTKAASDFFFEKWKTTTEHDFWPVVNFKWPNDANWREALLQQAGESTLVEYAVLCEAKLKETLRTDKAKARHLKRSMTGSWDDLDFEALITSKQRAEIRNQVIHGILTEAKLVLVDMPDYTKKDRRLITRDLGEVQSFWQLVLECGDTTDLVFFFQKELFGGHFFFGKLDVRELKPLTPEELVDAYMKKFTDTSPFELLALLEVARMSRGIFRRFKKYIRLCLEAFEEESNTSLISIDLVRRVITIDQLIADMELQLAEVFPKAEHRALAVRILEFVRIHPGLNQSQLAQGVGTDEVTMTRLLSKLQPLGYINKESGEGRERKITLGFL